MKSSDVLKLIPVERVAYFMQERESVRLKRLRGEPPPWTDDSVIGQYRFTR